MSKEERFLTKADIAFLKKGMAYFGFNKVRVKYSNSQKKFPDIWMARLDVLTIWVTPEWRRQNATSRKVRLCHELLHGISMEHDEEIGYLSRPEKDKFSRRVYNDIVRR